MTIAYAPSFLGSTERSASQYSEQQSLRNRLLEVQDDKNGWEDEIEDNALSSHQGENSIPLIGRTHRCSKSPESVSSRNSEDALVLMHDPIRYHPKPQKV